MKNPKPHPVVEMLAPSSLRARGNNARTHPPKQIEAIAKSIREFGFTAPVLIDTDGVIIAGHGRVSAAVHADIGAIPCVRVTHMTPAQIRAYVIADNRLAEGAAWDQGILGKELMALAEMNFDISLTGFEAPKIQLDEKTNESGKAEEEPAQTGIYGFREDVLFSSSNKWGIPDMSPEMLTDQIPHDTWTNVYPVDDRMWLEIHGEQKHPKDLKSILAFYVEDFRFESIWSEAVEFLYKLKQCNHVALAEPDFSLWWEMPQAVTIYNIYRARWCARYWAEAGFKIMPSLKWSNPESFEAAIAGLPSEIPVASVQCRTLGKGRAKSRFLDGLKFQLERLNVGTLIAYGGAESDYASLFTSLRCQNVILLKSYVNRRREQRMKGVK
jgi:hypothetical protein